MTPINIQEKYSNYYTASQTAEIVNFETVNYISILGNGSPGTNSFYNKKKALKDFSTQLQLQFQETEKAFENNIIEIFYWFDEKEGFVDIGDFYTTFDLGLLHYRITIRIDDFISEEDIKMVAVESTDTFRNQYELFTYQSGKCVQILHLGPFAGELETLPVLQKFATDNGLMKSGLHHEIHLVNFERGQNQEHLKTILRDGVRRI